MRKLYKESEIVSFLRGHAKIEDFYIVRTAGHNSSIIQYFDSSGQPWCLIIDNNILFDQAIIYLEKIGAQIFLDEEGVKKFEERRKAKNK